MRKFAIIVCAAALSLCAESLSGRRAPSFSLPDSSLKQFDILDYRGHWLLIDFMATNCPHCKLLSKALEDIKSRYGTRVGILSIVEPPDNLATVAKYITENKVTSPILFDQSQVAVSYFKATPSNPSFDTPHLFAVDPNGTIVHDWAQAAVEGSSFLKEFDQLMVAKH